MRRLRDWALVLGGIIILVLLIGAVIGGYVNGWAWTGMVGSALPPNYQPGKTLWDWLTLIAAPLAIAIATAALGRMESRRAEAFAEAQAEREQKHATEQAEREQKHATEQAKREQDHATAQAERERLIAELAYREQLVDQYLDEVTGLFMGPDDLRQKPKSPQWKVIQHRTLRIMRRVALPPSMLWSTEETDRETGAQASPQGQPQQKQPRIPERAQGHLHDLFDFLRDMGLLRLVAGGEQQAAGAQSYVDHLDEIDLSDCEIHGIDLSGFDLKNLKMSRSYIYNTMCQRANLTNFHADHCWFYGGSFDGLRILYSKDLVRAAIFEKTVFVNTSFVGANLKGADFSGADLRGANLTGAILDEATLIGARLDPETLQGVKSLIKAHFEDTDLGKIVLEGRDLSLADLSRAKMNAARLAGAKLRSAMMNDTILRDADLKGADFSVYIDPDHQEPESGPTNLSGADLSGADLSGAILTGATLTGAILYDVKIDASTKLTEEDLRGAKYDGRLLDAVRANAKAS